jgi:hypothetical protein
MSGHICDFVALIDSEISEICNMAICAYKKMSRVIWVEIHHHISMRSAGNNEAFFIGERRNVTKGAANVISL